MSQISIKAIAIGMFFGYILPTGIIWLISQLSIMLNNLVISSTVGLASLLWLFVFAPLVTGYLAAKYASVQPLFHSLIAIILPMLWVLVRGESDHLWVLPIFVISSTILAMLGARRYKIEAKL